MKTRAASAGKSSAAAIFSLGKYRSITLAVALFLLLDIGVLGLNLYISCRISEDAVSINLAGRQRMLVQRVAKALFAVQNDRLRGLPITADMEEVQTSAQLFDATLKAFDHGAVVPGGDGRPVYLRPATGPGAQEAVQQARALWAPYREQLFDLANGSATDAELRLADNFSKAHNLELLSQANQLASALEKTAAERGELLRSVQTAAIVLALLNFGFILFKFVRQLSRADAIADTAVQENRQILGAVNDGLFLITPQHRLASQISSAAHHVFGRPLRAGDDFFALLSGMVPAKALQDARDYVALLFARHVKESLVQNVNPLSEVQAKTLNRAGQFELRTLAFRFNRVLSGEGVAHLLVTVQDVSERNTLQLALQQERQRSQKELALLLAALDADPALLRQFVNHAERNLLEVNDLLQTNPADRAVPQHVLQQAARHIHTLKGDAAALGLPSLMHQAHAFESMLLRTLNNDGAGSRLSGDALAALPAQLQELLTAVSGLKQLVRTQRDGLAHASGQALNTALTRLAKDVAELQGKHVTTVVQMEAQGLLGAATADLVRDIAVQLVRNAVAHGIEDAATRLGLGKPAAGRVDVHLQRDAGEWILRIRDDGQGLHAASIRRRLVELGWYTSTQLGSFDEKQVVEHIFRPGFSTADTATVHAGRGVGLDVVQAHVQRLGGRLTMASTPGQFTEFTIRFETEQLA